MVYPSSVGFAFLEVRSNKDPPSIRSNRLMAFVSEGYDTRQRIAARVKLRSS